MSEKQNHYECLSCEAGFETRKQLQGHLNNGQTDCEWLDDEDLDLTDPAYHFSRELSKLKFNERVLAETW